MKKLPEAVSNKVTELFAALNYATDDLKIAGAEANLIGDFSKVTVHNNECPQNHQKPPQKIRWTNEGNFG